MKQRSLFLSFRLSNQSQIKALCFWAFVWLGLGLLLFALVRPTVSTSAQALPAGLPASLEFEVLTSTPEAESLGAGMEFIISRALTVTLTGEPTLSLTPTLTVTLPVTPTITVSPTLTVTVTPDPPDPPSPAFLPLLVNHYPEPQPDTPLVDQLLCSSGALSIPDDDPRGVSSSLTSGDNRRVVDLDVYLRIDHPWTGDLKVSLDHLESGKSIVLMDRPGYPASSSGCRGSNIITVLDDEASQAVEDKCAGTSPTISGSFKPEAALSAFTGDSLWGTWTLNVSDHSASDAGSLRQWCLDLTVSERMPAPTPKPEPVNLPAEAHITNISGQNQAMPLSCESRSAVDLAGYFGVSLNEYVFFGRLPTSDNPDVGFVGNVYGQWGQIPPNSYGVHAAPVAALLREYGLDAKARRYMAWDEVRAEIAARRPVEVWVIGGSYGAGAGRPVYYRAQDGSYTVVSPYEHTVILIGYTQNSVTILDGAKVYSRTLSEFLDSWSVLRNMAVTINPTN